MKIQTNSAGAQPSIFESILPLLVLLVLFSLGSLYLKLGDALIVTSMLGAAGIAGATAVRMGRSWDDIQNSIVEKIAMVFPIMLILLAIGGLIGAWMTSGTIPAFVWIGLKLINPAYIVLTAFLASALMSIFTGTSWGSAGTVGVALMGIAIALNAPLPAVAGAVVSGAYFGDKMSPLSDTTNVTAIAAGSELYSHIRHMTYTAFPSFIIAGIIYAFISVSVADSESVPNSAGQMIADIGNTFSIQWYVFIPPLVVLIAIWKKWPAVLGIAASAIIAAIIGVLGQGFSLSDSLSSLTTGFNFSMIDAQSADLAKPGDAFLTLVNRGGIYSMVNTFVVIIGAFILAGAMEASGALNVVVGSLLKAAKSVFSLIATTMVAGVIMLSLTSHGGVSALLLGGVFKEGYTKRNLAPENLSRTLEDSITLVDPLLPWTVSGVFMAATLGVPTLDYLPWAIFCLGGPIFTLLLALFYRKTGFGLKSIQIANDQA